MRSAKFITPHLIKSLLGSQVLIWKIVLKYDYLWMIYGEIPHLPIINLLISELAKETRN